MTLLTYNDYNNYQFYKTPLYKHICDREKITQFVFNDEKTVLSLATLPRDKTGAWGFIPYIFIYSTWTRPSSRFQEGILDIIESIRYAGTSGKSFKDVWKIVTNLIPTQRMLMKSDVFNYFDIQPQFGINVTVLVSTS